jgi:hypothetical protein
MHTYSTTVHLLYVGTSSHSECMHMHLSALAVMESSSSYYRRPGRETNTLLSNIIVSLPLIQLLDTLELEQQHTSISELSVSIRKRDTFSYSLLTRENSAPSYYSVLTL